jgi:hypothetical protein
MTVEENILKKANQKRLLGDLAIEGGNFTTAYFKSVSVNSSSECCCCYYYHHHHHHHHQHNYYHD